MNNDGMEISKFPQSSKYVNTKHHTLTKTQAYKETRHQATKHKYVSNQYSVISNVDK